MSDTKDEVQRYAALAVEYAETLNAIAQGEEPETGWLTDHGLEEEDELDLIDILNETALEVYANARINGEGSKDVRGVVVVLGTGGPHYEFEVNYRGNVEGRAYWGGEAATARGHDLDALGEQLVELFGGWDS